MAAGRRQNGQARRTFGFPSLPLALALVACLHTALALIDVSASMEDPDTLFKDELLLPVSRPTNKSSSRPEAKTKATDSVLRYNEHHQDIFPGLATTTTRSLPQLTTHQTHELELADLLLDDEVFMAEGDKLSRLKRQVSNTVNSGDEPVTARSVTAAITVDRTFTPSLADSTSTEFTNLKLQSETALTSVYQNSVPGFSSVDVTGFRAGSVIIDHDVIFGTSLEVNQTKVAEVLYELETTGTITIDGTTSSIVGHPVVENTSNATVAAVCYTCGTRTCIQASNGTYMCLSADFLPYGTANGDALLRKGDDRRTRAISLPGGLPMGNEPVTRFYVSTNGLLSFNSPLTGPYPRALPYNGRFLVCPYWSDFVNVQSQSYVSYQLYSNGDSSAGSRLTEVKQRASSEVGTYDGQTNFDATLVIVATWVNVTIGRSSFQERATFQTTIISDGQTSYMRVQFAPGEMTINRNRRRKFTVGFSSPQKSATFLRNQYDASVDTIIGNTGVPGLWFAKIGEVSNAAMRCYDWYWTNLPKRLTLSRRERALPKCLCSVSAVKFSRRWKFFSTENGLTCYVLNSNYRRYSKTCCYQDGALVTSPPNGGSLLVNSPLTANQLYVQENVDPKRYCCQESDLCKLYYTVRPSERSCSRRSSFRRSWGIGDPHIGLMDGGTYPFNGWGEYHMMVIKNSSGTELLDLQTRTCLAIDDNNSTVNASVFCAFAVKDLQGARFHVELNKAMTGLVVYVNGLDQTAQFNADPNYQQTVIDPSIEVNRENDSVIATFSSGVSLTVTPGLRQLVVSQSVPDEFVNSTSGLVGNYNGVQGDDYIYPNGTVLVSPSEREIFYFGQAWRVMSQQNSAFFYYPGYSMDDFQHPEFVPLFLDEVDNATMQGAIAVCGDSSQVSCLYDYLATGSSSFALTTKSSEEEQIQEDRLNANIAPSLNGTDLLEVTVGQAATVTLNASDENGDALTYLSLQSPSQGYTFDNGTGSISWTPSGTEAQAIRLAAKDPSGAMSEIYDPVIVLCDGCNNHGSCNFSDPRSSNSSLPNFQLAACECNTGWSGNSCETDTNGCDDASCMPGQNCTDLTPEEEVRLGVAYNCSECPTGFVNNATIGKCTDIDECTDPPAQGACDQICTNTEGSYICSCYPGYRRQGSCTDIDECSENQNNCDQLCTNTPGNYTCSCHAGFTLAADGSTCTKDAVDPCSGQQLNCTYACTVEGGTAKCICQNGFELAADGRSCQDIDECQRNLCSQTCVNNNGSYTCSCLTGYVLDADNQGCSVCQEGLWGMNCANQCQCRGRASACNPATGCVCLSGYTGTDCIEDIDECTDTPGICGSGKICVNNVGSYACQCPTGYYLATNGSCLDVDECQGSNSCEQTCTNTLGSYVCGCNEGYTLSNTTHCQDVDECTAQISGCAQQCHNLIGSYNCLCEFGFSLDANRRTCSKVSNPCAAFFNLNCQYGCRLNKTDNSTSCFCQKGFQLDTDNVTCIDVNECDSNSTNACTGTCVNYAGSYNCSCDVGFSLANDLRTCEPCDSGHWGADCANACACNPLGTTSCDAVSGCQCKAGWTGSDCSTDVNECNTNNGNCTANLLCVNTPGSYVCKCSDGYTLAANQSYCLDIDECSQTPAPCSQTCTNTPGNYTCACTTGFSLQSDGTTCTDIDECTVNDGGCEVRCRNTAGAFVCECNAGYILNATNSRTCDDIDECSQTPAPCSQTCTNTPGNYTCACTTGFSLQSDGTTCSDIDECATNNGGCSHTCNNTQGSYFCQCPTNFILTSDSRTCEATHLEKALTLTLNRTDNLGAMSEAQKAELRQFIIDALTAFFTPKLSVAFTVRITSLRSGSVIAQALFSLVQGNANNLNGEFSSAIRDLVQQGTLTVNGTSTDLNQVTYNNNPLVPSMSACDVLAVVSPCPSTQRCELTNGHPSCQDIPASTDLRLILGLGIGIPLFFILLGVIVLLVVLCLRRRDQQRHRILHAPEPSEADRYGRSIFATGMPTKGSFGARQYGLYNPDTLSEAASQTSGSSGGGGRRLGGKGYPRGRLYADDQPWYDNRQGARRDAGWEPEQPASNFSWDHMFRLLEPLGNLRIQRPNVTSSPHPAYASTETPRRPFYSDA